MTFIECDVILIFCEQIALVYEILLFVMYVTGSKKFTTHSINSHNSRLGDRNVPLKNVFDQSLFECK